MIGKIYCYGLSAVLFGIATKLILKQIRLWARGVNTSATVVDRESCQSDNTTLYSAIVEFFPSSERKVRMSVGMGFSDANSIVVGAKVTLRYDPKNPEGSAVLWSWSNLIAPPFAFLIMGIGMFWAGMNQ